jgi:hypothetical protein
MKKKQALLHPSTTTVTSECPKALRMLTHFLQNDEGHPQRTNIQKCLHLGRQHCCSKQEESNANWWSSWDLREHAWSPINAQPGEMCFWGTKGQNTRVPGISKRDRGQLRQDQCNSAYEASVVQKRNSEAHRQNRSIEPIHVGGGRAKPTIFHSA